MTYLRNYLLEEFSLDKITVPDRAFRKNLIYQNISVPEVVEFALKPLLSMTNVQK